jgi:hypothetical protein
MAGSGSINPQTAFLRGLSGMHFQFPPFGGRHLLASLFDGINDIL